MTALRHIFSVVPDCHAPAGHYATLWRNHFYDGLADVVERLVVPRNVDFAWARPWRPEASRLRADTSEQLWRQIQAAREEHGLDAVISYAFAADFELELVQRTIQSGVPWVNFYCDSTHRFSEIEPLARVTSLNWFPEHAALERYAALGRPTFCRPYAYHPKQLPDLTGRATVQPVAFIGLPTGNRITQLGWLALLGTQFVIRGHGWLDTGVSPFHNPDPRRAHRWSALFRPDAAEKILRRAFWPLVRRRARGPLLDGEFFDFLASCRVVLGLNQGRDERGRLASYMKFRDLEFPGYGCCYLTEHNADIETALEIGREVLTCTDMLDAASQLRELERQPDWARRIGAAGRGRVLAEHTWAARLREIAARL